MRFFMDGVTGAYGRITECRTKKKSEVEVLRVVDLFKESNRQESVFLWAVQHRYYIYTKYIVRDEKNSLGFRVDALAKLVRTLPGNYFSNRNSCNLRYCRAFHLSHRKSGTFLVGGPGKRRKREKEISKTCGGIWGTGCLGYPIIEVISLFCPLKCPLQRCRHSATAVRTPP